MTIRRRLGNAKFVEGIGMDGPERMRNVHGRGCACEVKIQRQESPRRCIDRNRQRRSSTRDSKIGIFKNKWHLDYIELYTLAGAEKASSSLL